VARILIAGCGCRGLALATALPDHVVRATTRSSERAAELEAAGIEAVVADPDRLGTLVRALEGVGVVCWLMGSAVDSPEVNGVRLSTLLEHLVDTPVRGFVYEAAGSVDASVLERGAQAVREASRRWRIRTEVVTADPATHDAWVEAMREAVERTMS
jgi:uncharacterized protein YbjT (DUF2867 family)